MRFHWPVWVPYPLTLLKAVVLGECFFSIVRSGYPFQDEGDLVFVVLIAWIAQGLIMPFYQFAYRNFMYWCQTWWPQRLPGYDFLKQRHSYKTIRIPLLIGEGLLALVVMALSLVISVILLVPFVGSPRTLAAAELQLSLISIVWILSAAYLYHAWLLCWVWMGKTWDKAKADREWKSYLLSERELRRLRKSKVKVTRRRYRPRKPKPVEPITMELNQIRKDLGLH